MGMGLMFGSTFGSLLVFARGVVACISWPLSAPWAMKIRACVDVLKAEDYLVVTEHGQARQVVVSEKACMAELLAFAGRAAPVFEADCAVDGLMRGVSDQNDGVTDA
jgi:hypothetical protein